jgi:hypothetical protein
VLRKNDEKFLKERKAVKIANFCQHAAILKTAKKETSQPEKKGKPQRSKEKSRDVDCDCYCTVTAHARS